LREKSLLLIQFSSPYGKLSGRLIRGHVSRAVWRTSMGTPLKPFCDLFAVKLPHLGDA
jgi:hypothetical protein